MAKTSLSAGAVIRGILIADTDVMRIAKKVFPVVTDKAELPYVAYRRSRLEHNPTKAKNPGADTVQIDINCYAATYEKSIELAEAVRAALDYVQGEKDGLVMRSCTLVDGEEIYEDDAYVQCLTFQVQI
ncbi:DUF3168 domain-containing protein [Candidatus Saccharibacteria bacterium]|nr:DUF3168 domain-containing protein [Candidatus Saccharibacteria bacterium]